MSEDGDDTDDELGQTGDQLNGIANRFGKTTDTSDATEMRGTSETSEMSETMGTDDSTTTQSAETDDMTGTTETSKTGETTKTPEPGDDDFQLREHWNGRTLYLPDEIVDDLDLRYKECSIKWQQQKGGELPKNEQFYPAVVRAALNETTIEGELGLE